MPRLILKPERDVDFYVVWSTIVDSTVDHGTRAQLMGRMGPISGAGERFARADAHGSSAAGDWIGYLGWGHDALLAARPLDEQRWLPRANLRAFAEAVHAGDRDAAHALTNPIEE